MSLEKSVQDFCRTATMNAESSTIAYLRKPNRAAAKHAKDEHFLSIDVVIFAMQCRGRVQKRISLQQKPRTASGHTPIPLFMPTRGEDGAENNNPIQFIRITVLLVLVFLN